MTDSRTQVLRKVRQALTTFDQRARPQHTMPDADRQGLFASARHFDSLVKKFQEELERAGGEVRICSDGLCAVELIKSCIEKEGFQTVAVSRHKICLELNLVSRLADRLPEVRCLVEGIDSENPYARDRLKEQMARVPLSITGIEYLIADTGTIVAVAQPVASRHISLLPEVHMVLATVDQIRPNLSDLFAEIQAQSGANLPGSAITLITGPSRTADIEKVLIKGVHGPTRLVVVLVEKFE
ncbi:MAG TPA: lactate utilization protein [Terriglobia bacterium]|nr:lactate utilization protein [Terriglobia bacterium]